MRVSVDFGDGKKEKDDAGKVLFGVIVGCIVTLIATAILREH